MSERRRSVRRARRQGSAILSGYIVTWDVASENTALCARLRRYIFGYTSRKGGKAYRYPGFVERAGVRYLGQSVLFVSPALLSVLRGYLRSETVDHVVIEASVGPVLPN